MKKLKIILIAILVGLFTIPNFFDDLSNNGNVYGANDFTNVVNTPAEIKMMMETACFDCHSNKTNYMWYSGIAPISLLLNNHIDEGKKELNFSVNLERLDNILERKEEENRIIWKRKDNDNIFIFEKYMKITCKIILLKNRYEWQNKVGIELIEPNFSNFLMN
jgi:hypothetical protein